MRLSKQQLKNFCQDNDYDFMFQGSKGNLYFREHQDHNNIYIKKEADLYV